MANTHLPYPDLAIEKFSGTDPDQVTETFIQLIERKINSALGDAPENAGELANYTFRKKALFFSLLRGPVAREQSYQRNNLGECSNKIHHWVFRWTKRIPIPNGSGTLYNRRWKRNSELPTTH